MRESVRRVSQQNGNERTPVRVISASAGSLVRSVDLRQTDRPAVALGDRLECVAGHFGHAPKGAGGSEWTPPAPAVA